MMVESVQGAGRTEKKMYRGGVECRVDGEVDDVASVTLAMGWWRCLEYAFG